MNPVQHVKRRSFAVLLFLTLTWGVLVSRLWWIQLGSPHHFSAHGIDLVKNAVKQRQQTIILHSGRGDILDRHGHSFTGVEQKVLILFPLARGSLEGSEQTSRLAEVVGQPAERLLAVIRQAKQPAMLRDEKGRLMVLTDEQAEAVNRLQIPGVLALEATERYRPDEVAKHVIGFVNQNPDRIKSLYAQELRAGKMSLDSMVGAAGLEQSFDRFLQGEQVSSLSYYVDGLGKPLRGLQVSHTTHDNEFYPLSLVTTLDREIQQRMEEVADRTGLRKGSIVVLDVENGDVAAMVSRPQYDQTRVQLEAGDWQNRALIQLPPGSVFKTVVAAAALGEGLVRPHDEFLCEGEYGKYGFSCWKEGGHGVITMEEAFAESCNIAFAQIAKKVGGEKIEAYAKRLGLGSQVGHLTPQLFNIQDFRQFAQEQKGSIFASEEARHDEGALIQTAIGQRDVRVTPLQAANMMVTILRGGSPGYVRIVSEITYRNGLTFYHFSPKRMKQEGIDPYTARRLQRMLRQVVEEGTGTRLQSLPWTTAGKSGTAQVTAAAGDEAVHQWFVGYAPVENPRYAIAVVAEDQPAWGSHKATAVFGEVVAALADQSPESDESLARHR